MSLTIKILLVEDNPGDARLIREMLAESEAARFELHHVDRLADAIDYLGENYVDIILLDLSLPDSQGLDSLDRILIHAANVTVVVLSGLDDEDAALLAVHRGAQDYLIKGQVDYQLLIRALRYALERKRTEHALRKAMYEAETERAKNEAVVASVGIGMCVVDRGYRIIYQNKISRDLEGIRVGEVCYKYCANNEEPCNICPVDLAFNDGNIHKVQRKIDKDGREIYLDIVASPLKNADGEIIGGIKVVVDVTERRLAEQAMERLSRQNQLLLDSAGEGIIGLDIEGRHTLVNPAAARMLGYEPEEMVGRYSHTMWHHTRSDGTLYPQEECPIYGAFRGGEVRRGDDEIFWRKDGTSFPVEYISTPIHENGTLAGSVVTFLDISERKKAEEILRESEERYRDLFENASDLIQSVTPDGHFQYVNRTWLDTLGYSEEEVGNLTVFEIICPEGRWHCEKLFDEVMQGKDVGQVEVGFRTKDDRDIYVEGSVNAKMVDGKVVSSRGIFRDITERKKIAGEREKLQERLLQAQKMEAVGTLAGGVAHDFNNLLTTIQGYTDLAMRTMDKDLPLYKDLEAIYSSCRRGAGIVRQLLLFSRKQVMEMRPLSINLTVAALCRMLERLLGENIAIVPDLAEDLPTVLADQGNIEQVVMNLALNARDAMPTGGKITIKTEMVKIDAEYCGRVPKARPGNHICLSVTDEGTGLDKEVLEHLFEPFFTTKDVGKGTGLGLSVVYGIVEAHNGWIEVRTEKDRGTSFRIYLPTIDGKSHVEIKPLFPFEDLQGNGERILLIEDENDLRELARLALAKNGYTVFAAATGREAYELYDREQGNFDLVFSDVVLPDTNGVQIVQNLLDRKPGLPVLLSSGYTDDKAQRRIIEQKKYRFLEKPYSLPRLMQTVRELIKAASLKRPV